MANKPIILTGVIILAASFIASLLIIIPAAAKTNGVVYDNTWTDNFTSTQLNSRWGWVREDSSNWTLSARPGYMRINTQSGNLTYARNDQENLLLTSQIPGDFSITTRLSFTPTQNYHQAGLIVYQDDDNYIKLHSVYDSGKKWAGYLWEEAGSPGVCGAEITANDVWLKMTKTGSFFVGFYSLNGVDWNQVCTGGNMSLTNPRVGLEVSDDYATTSIPADFDYFTLEDNIKRAYLPLVIR